MNDAGSRKHWLALCRRAKWREMTCDRMNQRVWRTYSDADRRASTNDDEDEDFLTKASLRDA